MKTVTRVVSRADAGVTLQDFIAVHLALSRNRAKALLDSRGVLVNRERVWMARHILQPGDSVQIMETAPTRATRNTDIAILFDDGGFIVADKPPGIVSNGPDSIESNLQQQLACPDLLAVHRLDRDTTGCLLLARSSALFDKAVAWFRSHRVRKAYHVLVVGSADSSRREVRSLIDGRTAVTRLTVLDSCREASHLYAEIVTGRTHQIRRHLIEIGLPVLGDRQYGHHPLSIQEATIPRQMLHAALLEFPSPTCDARHESVQSQIPADFRKAMRLFGLK
jgi:23S rRNA-/tRNA-specific pseudouridylate synthase